MKVLFLLNLSDQLVGLHNINEVPNLVNCSAFGLTYPLDLLKEFSKYAEVEIYSPPVQSFIQSAARDEQLEAAHGIVLTPNQIPIPQDFDAQQLAEEVHPDIIIQYTESIFPFVRNFEKANCFRVMWFPSAPQDIFNTKGLLDFLDKRNVDLAIKSVDSHNATFFGKKFVQSGVETLWLPPSIDGRRFRHLGSLKGFALTCIGNLNPAIYPLRIAMSDYVRKVRKWSYYMPRVFGEEYVQSINMCKIFLTCGGRWRFPVLKYFEVRACRTMLLAEETLDSDALGFKDGENYVSLKKAWYPKVENPKYPIEPSEWQFDETEFTKIIDYYLKDYEERERIALNGEKLIQERHTNEIIAKQLFELLSSKV